MIIQHNMAALNTNRQIGNTGRLLAKNAERLNSGYKINRAADNAAGLAISEKMRAQIRGLKRGAQNVEEGISFCNVADAGLQEVHSILDRMKELSVQAGNDTNTYEDRMAMEYEIQALRKEINRISTDTEFNTQKIFCVPYEVNFSNNINVVQIFDDENGPNGYGGIIIESQILGEDTRVNWADLGIPIVDAVDEDGNVILDDAGNPVQAFVPGTYTYNTGWCDLEIECKDGNVLPEIKVSFPVVAEGGGSPAPDGTGGIRVAGRLIEWPDILDEDDQPITQPGKEGYYHFAFGDAAGVFYVDDFDSFDDIVNGINNCNAQYHRKYISEYDGSYEAQAVDITDAENRVTVTNDFYQSFVSSDSKNMNMVLKADDTGIWLVTQNEDGTEGAVMSGSKKRWDEILYHPLSSNPANPSANPAGIYRWTGDDMSGGDADGTADISDAKTYYYAYGADSAGNPLFQFDFTLLDETDLESVIEGLNGAVVGDLREETSDKFRMAFDNGDDDVRECKRGVVKRQQTNFTIKREGEMGRNFDYDFTAHAGSANEFFGYPLSYDFSYNPTAGSFELAGTKTDNGDTVLNYHSVQVSNENDILGAIDKNKWNDYFRARGIQSLFSGQPPEIKDLVDVLGGTQVGNNFETVAITSQMKRTEDISGSFSAIKIDFSGLGTDFQLYDLLGTGFDSTCGTCSNHYSVMFVYGGTNSVTSDGYGYSYQSDGQNYTLKIDIESMMKKGIRSGSDFSDALIDIMDAAGFDFHYQQYASDNGKLYLMDNRNLELGSFSVASYGAGLATIDIRLQEDHSPNYLDLEYDYNLMHNLTHDQIAMYADAISAPDGDYIMEGGRLKIYNAADYYNPDGTVKAGVNEAEVRSRRCNLNLNSDGFDWDAFLDSIDYDQIMQSIAEKSRFDLQGMAPSYVDYHTDENESLATVSTFDFHVEDTRGFWIQAGANSGQGIVMDWDGFNSYTLGLWGKEVDVMSAEHAGDMNNRVEKAIQTISSTRSLFGAYTNRFGHAYANNTNSAENLQFAESKLRDTEMADEMVQFAKNTILMQAGQAMLTQANQINQGILQLLR